MANAMDMMKDAPIPGENYTSDTKHYPWHQSPKHSNLNDALDNISNKITDPKVARGIVSLAEMGFPLVRVAQMIIMEGISQGQWTMDLALLLAGPVTKIIQIMCDVYGVEYMIGIEENPDDFSTGHFFKGLNDLVNTTKNKDVIKIISQDLPDIEKAAEQQQQASPDGSSGGDQGKTQDLQDQGFAAMTSGAPK